jgi:TRAP-type C4-dicarboxylate transport system permease large subunit
MSDLTLGALYGAVTLVVMFSGMPIAFALGVVATGFMYFFMPESSLDTITQNVYEEMASSPCCRSAVHPEGRGHRQIPAGKDLYSAIHTWMHKLPGGLGIANVFACALFAAMAGSSPATCSAIGSAGIPEMRKRGYSPGFAAGIIAAGGTLGILLPPSITMILYAVAAEQSLGRCSWPASARACCWWCCSPATPCTAPARNTAWRWTSTRKAARSRPIWKTSTSRCAKVEMLPRVLPFIVLLIGVMVALYGGFATPSETAGLGALLALALLAVIYGVWRRRTCRPSSAPRSRNRPC